jgi:hypothetical protein
MDLVAGRKNQGTVDGDMLFDGKPRPSYFKRVAGYVWSTAQQLLHVMRSCAQRGGCTLMKA